VKARILGAAAVLVVALGWMSGPLQVRWPGAIALAGVSVLVGLGAWSSWWPEALAAAGVLVFFTGPVFLVLGAVFTMPFLFLLVGKGWRALQLSVLKAARGRDG